MSSKDRVALEKALRERQREASRLAWKRALSRHGPDGAGPRASALAAGSSLALARSFMSLIQLGPGSGLPKGVDPKLAAFVAGKELAGLAEGRGKTWPFKEAQGGALTTIANAAQTPSDRSFELALAFVEGARARLEGQCEGRLFAFWVNEQIRLKRPERLERLLRSGVSPNAGQVEDMIGRPLRAAIEAGDAASVQTLLRYGADAEDWNPKSSICAMAQKANVGVWADWLDWNELTGFRGDSERERPLAGVSGLGCAGAERWRQARGGVAASPGMERLAQSLDNAQARAIGEAWLLSEQARAPAAPAR